MNERTARIELSHAAGDLDLCQAKARAGQQVTLHFTNWPGTPSVPVTVLPGSDPDGNIRFADGRKMHAMADELSTIPRRGLEVRDWPADDRCQVCHRRDHHPGDSNAGHPYAAPPPPERVFTMARMRQGFRDQAHLDAFYAYYDHVQAGRGAGPAGCGCGQPGPAGETTGGGWQPSEQICPAGRALSEAAS